MYSIAMANYKGGTGKSTAAIHLAVAAAERMDVAIVDTDQQRSIASWASQRDKEKPLVVEARARDLAGVLHRLRRIVDFCVIDCPGHDWAGLAKVVSLAQLTVVVGRPTLFDVNVSIRVNDLLAEHKLAHAFLLSQVQAPHGSRFTEWTRAYEKLGTIVHPPITHRVAYQDALKLGLGVTEYAPRSQAAAEICDVLKWVLNRMRRL